MNIQSVSFFFIIGSLIFLGYFYEAIYKRYKISDLILLILTGFIIGPYGLGILKPTEIPEIFIQFVLLFLVFNGAFKIDFKTIANQMFASLKLSVMGYFVSMIMVSIAMFIYTQNIIVSLLVGAILGGISSTFVIPLLEINKNVNKKEFTIELLEGTLTDVFTIVVSIALIGVFELNTFNVQTIISDLINLFALGTFIGFVGGIIWIYTIEKLFKENYYYVVTIGYLFIIYSLTEYIGGNGVIAALFLGLTLKNSKRVVIAGAELISSKEPQEYFKLTPSEEFFYGQISFFIKTFFFILIGATLQFEWFYIVSGLIFAILISFGRAIVVRILKIQPTEFYSSIFGRGVAAAVIAEITKEINLIFVHEQNIILSTIIWTILLSALSFFYYLLQERHKNNIHEKENGNKNKKMVVKKWEKRHS